MIRRRLLLGAAAALLMTGCTSTPPAARRWAGRFSLRVTDPAGRRQAQSGRFELLEAPDLLRLDLLSPLSGVMARIEETPQGASLRRSLAGPAEEDRSIAALCRRLLGFPLPVRELLELLQEGAAAQDDRNIGEWHCRIHARSASGRPQRLQIERSEPPSISLILLLEDPQ